MLQFQINAFLLIRKPCNKCIKIVRKVLTCIAVFKIDNKKHDFIQHITMIFEGLCDIEN